MRKLTLLTLILGTIAIAGCGGSSGDEGSSPLDNALRYLPADAPFAVAIETDIAGEQFRNAGGLADQFALGDQLSEQLEDVLGDRAGQLEQIQQALGNEFVVGSTDARSFLASRDGEDTAFVGAIQAESQDAVDQLIEGDKADRDGEIEGATVYTDDSGDPFAIDGDVLVVAGSRQQLEDALATRNGEDSLTEESFDAGTEGVSEDALLRAYVNIGELLQASPEAKPALRSKWVAALRTAGVALTFEDDEVAVDVEVKTDPDGLTDADLPIAAGPDSPEVLDRDGEINLALRDPSQLLAFAQATAREIDPKETASFQVAKGTIERELGVDLDEELVGQLDGDLAVSIRLDGTFGARAQLQDPAAFKQTLTKLEGILGDIASGAAGERVGVAKPKAGEDFYAVATSGGGEIVFGVVEDVFVLSNDPDVAASLASAQTEPVSGAKGALVLSTDAEQLAKIALEQAAGQGFDLEDRIKGAIGTRPLDELVGSFEVTTNGLSGSFTLATD
jgi:hypothetical protein